MAWPGPRPSPSLLQDRVAVKELKSNGHKVDIEYIICSLNCGNSNPVEESGFLKALADLPTSTRPGSRPRLWCRPRVVWTQTMVMIRSAVTVCWCAKRLSREDILICHLIQLLELLLEPVMCGAAMFTADEGIRNCVPSSRAPP